MMSALVLSPRFPFHDILHINGRAEQVKETLALAPALFDGNDSVTAANTMVRPPFKILSNPPERRKESRACIANVPTKRCAESEREGAPRAVLQNGIMRREGVKKDVRILRVRRPQEAGGAQARG